MLEDKVREKSSTFLHRSEAVLYIVVGILLAIAAAGGTIQAAILLWRTGTTHGIVDFASILDQLLVVLMMVELLHTVRISVRSQTLIMEPFLIVGLIASIRRVLVITMQAAKIAEQGQSLGDPAAAAAFRNTMIELGILGFLILAFAFAIYLLRRAKAHSEILSEQ